METDYCKNCKKCEDKGATDMMGEIDCSECPHLGEIIDDSSDTNEEDVKIILIVLGILAAVLVVVGAGAGAVYKIKNSRTQSDGL
jgi:hypothetical protein